jgi:hypothetical protein
VISHQTFQLADVMTLMTGPMLGRQPGQLFRPVE